MNKSEFEYSIRVERYKYVLDRKKELNNSTFRIASFFHAVALAVGSAQFIVLEKFSSGSISERLCQISSGVLLALMILCSTITLAILISGILSWIDYRNEEHGIIPPSKLGPPAVSWKNIYRWYETYVIFGVILYAAAYSFVILMCIIPSP